MVHVPIFVIDSLGGLPGCSTALFLFFEGFDQYFSKIPSLSHFFRDRSRDSAITPLH
jgi:hypothetical protein